MQSMTYHEYRVRLAWLNLPSKEDYYLAQIAQEARYANPFRKPSIVNDLKNFMFCKNPNQVHRPVEAGGTQAPEPRPMPITRTKKVAEQSKSRWQALGFFKDGN